MNWPRINCKCYGEFGICTHQVAPRRLFGAAKCILLDAYPVSDPRRGPTICLLHVNRPRPAPPSGQTTFGIKNIRQPSSEDFANIRIEETEEEMYD